MNIGEASKSSGVNSKMIRHYESIGLISKPKRTASGYRIYDLNDVHTLRFIRRSRELGFSMKEIKKLLSLWKNRSRSSAEVKALARSHIVRLEEKILELQAMRNTLSTLMQNCSGDSRPDCPILKGLSDEI